ncbi:major facilitator superfamily domain-containing protein [Lyophyllum atratum]|nr:major facilitator superfamily domain-containing protein [Lyophyllum atratum]
MKTVMSEMTDRSNLPQLWGFLPISWCVGVTFAPVIGGYLSRPADRFPELFGQNTFLKTYPYFLPCAFPATFSVISWIITFYCLKETHKSPISVYQLLKGRNDPKPRLDTGSSVGLRGILIPRVIIAVGNYACIALVEVAFRGIQPLFFATPIKLGGLGLPPPKIGNILSISGALCGIIQVFFFARVHHRLGSKRTVIWGLVFSLPLFLMFPLASVLVRSFGFGALLWVTVGAQAILSVGYGLSFGAIFIYITAAAPSQASLGATHGLSQMTTSIMRAIGPATANGLFSLSIEHNYLGGYLVYYALFMIACIVLSATSLLPRRVWGQ